MHATQTPIQTRPADLGRLFRTVFELSGGERFAVFTDLTDLSKARDLAFLADPALPIQRHAYRTFYEDLLRRREELGIGAVSFFIYEATGGSNLDLPGTVLDLDGRERPLREVLREVDIALYVSTYSATAPLTALAKELSFRGATMHGVNDLILATGLAADYEQVSARAERLRRAIEGADEVRLEFGLPGGERHALRLDLRGQAAQKSHGLVRTLGDIANLPAGEVYFVPRDADGFFPRKFDDGALGLFEVRGRQIVSGRSIAGDGREVAAFLAKIAEDANAGQIGELGLGTQSLPFAGADIQDEKILGTAHVATGRSDHLGGSIDGKSFKNRKNAVHDDILFAPNKTPEVALRAVMLKGGREVPLIEGYRPTAFIEALL